VWTAAPIVRRMKVSLTSAARAMSPPVAAA
jgi:hypothetical protein